MIINRQFTIKELKEAIKDLPDDTIVLVPSEDHSYRPCRLWQGTAMYQKKGNYYTEDHGDKYTPEGPEYGKRIKALIVD